MANQRLDQKLFELGLAPSRSKAKELIQAGFVEVKNLEGWTVISQPSYMTTDTAEIRCNESALLKYVSRSGLKLEGALQKAKFQVSGLKALDIGQSTGGFTDCLLQHGAKEVVGVEVGHGQVHESLANRGDVHTFEGLNIKDIAKFQWFQDKAGYFDLVVCDVSFISIQQALPPALPFLKNGGELFLLIKPQFELGKKALNKKGLVTDPNLSETMSSICEAWTAEIGLTVLGFFESQIKGQDGNQEFILHAQKSS